MAVVAPWCNVITTAQLHSTRPEFRLCTGSHSARSVSTIRHGEDLWQWSRLEISLNVFRRLTLPQKQFIIIIIIIIMGQICCTKAGIAFWLLLAYFWFKDSKDEHSKDRIVPGTLLQILGTIHRTVSVPYLTVLGFLE